MRKLINSYIFSLVLLSMIMVACSSGMASSEKVDEIEMEESASSVESAPIETLPPIIKTAEVSDFLSVQLTPKDFENFNSDSVRYSDDPGPAQFLLDFNRKETLKPDVLEHWGAVDKFSPDECEYFYLLRGATQRLVDSKNITGMLWAGHRVKATNVNLSRSKLVDYLHVVIVYSNFEVSKNFWDAKLGSYSNCFGGYEILLTNGTVRNIGGNNSNLYTNSENNILLEHVTGDEDIDAFQIDILQGGIHHVFRFYTGSQIKKGESFSFLDELIQKSLDEASKIQSLETFSLDLGNLSTFNPEEFTFNKPNLGSGGSV